MTYATGSSSELCISHYQDEIPLFVGPELERLYGNLYSSLPHFATEGKLQNTSTYIVQKEGELITVFLFRIKEGRLEVLNEVIRIAECDITRFACYVFGVFKTVNIIVFRSIQPDIHRLPFRFQRFNCLEDMVIELPSKTSEYMLSLSPKTRKGLRHKLKIITRDFPSFTFRIFEGPEINVQHIREIIQLNKMRMAGMNKISSVTDAAEQRIIRLAQERGLVVIASIDGKVCGGMINCRIGANHFSLMVAHDPQYNAYSLGLLTGFRGICEAIARGGKEFHWLWGRYAYKYSFLAAPRELDYLVLYRSKIQFALNAGFAIKVWLKGQERKLRLWAHQAKQEERFIYMLTLKIWCFRRKLA